MRPLSRRGTSVRDDWRAWLPESKASLNESCSRELDALYNILSVSLNEAIELRKCGSYTKACETVYISRGICVRLSHALELVLGGLHRHAKLFPVAPNIAPLDPANFQGARGQRTAKFAGLLSRVLLSQRSQFIHKASTLKEMVTDLSEQFCRAVDDLVSGVFYRTDAFWATLLQCYFDLNTCLCEALVLLKSFLVVLPDEQISSFQSGLKLSSSASAEPALSFRHRRFAEVPGK